MAVVQPSKAKVRPVMDYKELDEHVDAFTADADICAAKVKGVVPARSKCSPSRRMKSLFVSLFPNRCGHFKLLIRGKRYCLT